MPALEVILTIPPSANQLFANASGKGRVKTERYTAWIELNGWKPIAGAWRRFTAENECRTALPWTFNITVHGMKQGRDLSNCVKAIEDLIVTMTGLEDSNVQHFRAAKLPLDDSQPTPCVVVWVSTL